MNNNKTVRMVARRPMYYDGDRKTAEEFDVREEHVRALVITGSADVVDSNAKTKRYNRRDLRAED